MSETKPKMEDLGKTTLDPEGLMGAEARNISPILEEVAASFNG